MERIIQLIKQDDLRLKALECVEKLNVPQCYLAAGFVRNLVWDHLHNKSVSTPLNDADVIYFNANESDTEMYSKLEAKLALMMPELNWQVRNQALMHLRNDDKPYLSCVDAMSYWPEKETATAIRKTGTLDYECISAFGFECLFQLSITHNPKRPLEIFKHRVKSKSWLAKWPNLRIAHNKTADTIKN